MYKLARCNLDVIRAAVETVARQLHQGHLHVDVRYHDSKTAVHSGSILSRLMHNHDLDWFCIFSCLCICSATVDLYAKSRVQNILVAYYPLACGEQELVRRIESQVVESVKNKYFGKTVVVVELS